VVSTAIHEFFGVSVLEAIYADCFPLLPDRLSYPELLPADLHQRHLYPSRGELLRRLRYWLKRPKELRGIRLWQVVTPYSWKYVAPKLDAALGEVLAQFGG